MGFLTDIGRGIQGFGDYRQDRQQREAKLALEQQLAKVQADREVRLEAQNTQLHNRMMAKDKSDSAMEFIQAAPPGMQVTPQMREEKFKGTVWDSYLTPHSMPDLEQDLMPDPEDESILKGTATEPIFSGENFDIQEYMPPGYKAQLARLQQQAEDAERRDQTRLSQITGQFQLGQQQNAIDQSRIAALKEQADARLKLDQGNSNVRNTDMLADTAAKYAETQTKLAFQFGGDPVEIQKHYDKIYTAKYAELASNSQLGLRGAGESSWFTPLGPQQK